MSNLSIEQFELIRRLRNSGIKKEEIWHAFDQLEDVEKRFGDVYSVPHTHSLSSGHSNKFNVKKLRQAPSSSSNQIVSISRMALKGSDHFSGDENSQFSNSNGKQSSQEAMQQQNSSSVSDVLIPHLSRNGLTICAVSTPQTSNANHYDENPNRHVAIVNKVKRPDETKPEQSMLSEIRHFIVRYNVKLSMIADMANIPPTTLRNYIHGNLSLVSEEAKQKIHTWFQMMQNMASESAELIPLKRERFVFRTSHLRILEEHYKTDPYPDNAKRDYISVECNRAYEQECGQQITDSRDRVTMTVVSNWFNNRRKEAKRQQRIGIASQMGSSMLECSIKVDNYPYDGVSSPTTSETVDSKQNVQDMIQSSTIHTPPSYSSNEDNESSSFMQTENDAFIPIQNIKQEPPDIN